MSVISCLNVTFGFQPSFLARLREVAAQVIDLGGPQVPSVELDEVFPREPSVPNDTSRTSRTEYDSPVAIT